MAAHIRPLDPVLAPYVDTLPDRLRSVLYWRLQDGLTHADIASRLNVTRSRSAELEQKARVWLRIRYERQRSLRPTAPYAEVAQEREATRRAATGLSMVCDCGVCGAKGSVALVVGLARCQACGAEYVSLIESGAEYVPHARLAPPSGLVGTASPPAVRLELHGQTCGRCGSGRVVLLADADTAWRACLECGAMSLSGPWLDAPGGAKAGDIDA